MTRDNLWEPTQAPESEKPRYAPTMTQDRDSEKETASQGSLLDASAGTDDGSGGTPRSRPERRGPPPNPIYHPLFLPILLIGGSLWFGYDGFLTTDPDMLNHQTFNRIMFAIMLPICIWKVPRGIREFREDQAKAAKMQAESKSS